MKKILTVSLVAIMAVSAARADIASVQYVDDSIKPVSQAVATKAEAADLQALTTTVSDMDEAYKAADQTLTGKIEAIEAVSGTVDSVVSQGSANPVSSAAVYTALQDKQGNLSDDQMAAVNSTITAGKVATYDAYDATIKANTAAAQAAAQAAEAAQTTADGKQAALTPEQLAAVNSNITAEKVAAYDAYNTTITNMDAEYKLADQNINTELGKKANSADVYTKTESDAKYQLTFGDAASCTLNGTFECAAVVGTDGVSLAWKRIIDSAEQKATSAANAY